MNDRTRTSDECPSCGVDNNPFCTNTWHYRHRPSNPITYALECFEAALAEGWLDALADGDIDRIRDLWLRRISYAHKELRAASETSDVQRS